MTRDLENKTGFSMGMSMKLWKAETWDQTNRQGFPAKPHKSVKVASSPQRDYLLVEEVYWASVLLNFRLCRQKNIHIWKLHHLTLAGKSCHVLLVWTFQTIVIFSSLLGLSGPPFLFGFGFSSWLTMTLHTWRFTFRN